MSNDTTQPNAPVTSETEPLVTAKRREPQKKSIGGYLYLAIDMAGGWFPITIFFMLAVPTFVIMYFKPETASFGFGFLSASVIPLIIGHQGWKTRQTVMTEADDINKVSRQTTENIPKEIAHKLTDKVIDKVTERLGGNK